MTTTSHTGHHDAEHASAICHSPLQPASPHRDSNRGSRPTRLLRAKVQSRASRPLGWHTGWHDCRKLNGER
jgi:hypothetical protein